MTKIDWLNQAVKNDYKTIKRSIKNTFSTKRNQRRGIYTGLGVLCIVLLIGLIFSINTTVKANNLLYQRNIKLQQLHTSLESVKKEKAVSDTEIKAKAAHEADLQKSIDDLNKQLQSKKEAQSIAAAVVDTVSPRVYAAPAPSITVSGCGDNFYAHFIYMRESGCSLTVVNGNGCRGIGQACPGSKLPCGADYGCQNAYFTNYAISTYGSWANAYNTWLSKGWW